MNIAFIGLGIMGRPMALNLIKAGHTLHVFDVVKTAMDPLVAAGATPCQSAAQAAAASDMAFVIVPNSPHVENAVFGEGGIAQGAKPNLLVVDMSSLSPGASRQIAERARAAGLRFMDAPVSGGEPKAIDGTLAFMIGGDERDYHEALLILKNMGNSFVHIGPWGAGCAAKLANQIIVNLNIAALSEGMILLAGLGVDRQKVFEAIRGGLAGSAVMEAKAPMMIKGDFTPGGRLDINMKDIHNVLDAADDIALPLPLTAQLYEMIKALKRQGLMGHDHAGIVEFYERLSNLEVKQ